MARKKPYIPRESGGTMVKADRQFAQGLENYNCSPTLASAANDVSALQHRLATQSSQSGHGNARVGYSLAFEIGYADVKFHSCQIT